MFNFGSLLTFIHSFGGSLRLGYHYSLRNSALRLRLHVLSYVNFPFFKFHLFNSFGLVCVFPSPRLFLLSRFPTWVRRMCFRHVSFPCMDSLSVCRVFVILCGLPQAIRPCCGGGFLVHSICSLLRGFGFIPSSHGALISQFLCHVKCAGGPSRGVVCPIN